MSDRPFHLRAPADPRPRRDVGPPFQRLNGRWLALDFVNTVHAWVPGGDAREGHDWCDRITEERLAGYGDLIRWSEAEDILDEPASVGLAEHADINGAEAADAVRRARALRASLYRLFRAGIEAWEPLEDDLRTLDAERERLAPNEALVREHGGFRLEWRSEAPALEALLWPPVRSAVALLTDPENLARVRQCDGETCGWLFYDTPRGRPRRWCDIRDCGNVAKVRAYRRRERPQSYD